MERDFGNQPKIVVVLDGPQTTKSRKSGSMLAQMLFWAWCVPLFWWIAKMLNHSFSSLASGLQKHAKRGAF